MRNRDEIRAALTGPVASVRTPFRKDGNLDVRSLRSLVETLIAAGGRTLLLTAGDSLYSLLSPDEIAEVTRLVVEQTRGRVMVVAADNGYATPQAIEFAKFARQVGADLYMVKPPDWAGATTPETLAAHYAAVTRHIPAMLVTNIFAARGHAFGLQTIRLLLERVPGVVAVKDDICGEFGRKLALLTYGRWAVFSGGRKENHLDIHPYGCDGYLSTFITLRPDLSRQYWQAIAANDVPGAVRLIRDYERPFFDYILGLRGGFDAGMHGTMELFGLCRRWRRPPYHSLSDEEMEQLAAALKKLNLLRP